MSSSVTTWPRLSNPDTAVTRRAMDLLLCCARTGSDAERADRLKGLLRTDIDWPDLIRLARWHGLTPLLCRTLGTAGGNAIPTSARTELWVHARVSRQRSEELARELLVLAGAFETHGIAAIPFKGPVLAALAYGDVGLRPCADLDVAVHRKDVPGAVKLLIGRGYRPVSRRLFRLIDDSAAVERAARRSTYCTFVRGDGEDCVVRVDLQWRLADPCFSFRLDAACLWEHAASAPCADGTVPSFATEDLLLVLCAHGSKHLWQKLLWVCDVAWLVRAHPDMEWEHVLERAGRLGGRRMVSLGLCLARELLDAPLPGAIARAVTSDRAARALASQVARRLLSAHSHPPDDLERTMFLLAVRERWRDRVRHYAGLAAHCQWMPLAAMLSASCLSRRLLERQPLR